MNMQSSDQITLIVGAGVTGLTAAYTLANAGVKCVLLEKGAAVGGDCRTYVIDGITFDLGPHVLLLNPDVEADRLLLALLEGENTISRTWCVAFHAKGKYWKFPPSLLALPFYPRQYLKEIILARLKKKKDIAAHPDSLQYFIEEKTGHAYYQDLFSSFILKKTCMTGDRVHRDWFMRTDRDVRNQKEPPQKPRRLTSWYYPSKGFERIPQKLWEKYQRAGGETIVNCGPLSFEKTNDRIITATCGNRTYPVKDVIWTASVNELNGLLGANVPPATYIDTLLVCLTYNRKERTHRPFIYTYHPQEDLIFNRVYYPDHIYGDKSLPDREGICLEINDFKTLQGMSDDAIVAGAIRDVEKLGLYKEDALRQRRHFWLKECMPVYELDYERRLQEIFQAIRGYHNLYAVGRRGGYFFCQTPAAANQGLKVAKHLLQGRQ